MAVYPARLRMRCQDHLDRLEKSTWTRASVRNLRERDRARKRNCGDILGNQIPTRCQFYVGSRAEGYLRSTTLPPSTTSGTGHVVRGNKCIIHPVPLHFDVAAAASPPSSAVSPVPVAAAAEAVALLPDPHGSVPGSPLDPKGPGSGGCSSRVPPLQLQHQARTGSVLW